MLAFRTQAGEFQTRCNVKSRMMISFNQFLILVIVLFCSCWGLSSDDVGGNKGLVADSPESSTSTNSNIPVCRTVRNIKRLLQSDFEERNKHDLVCDIEKYSNCNSVTCTSDLNEKILAGFSWNICPTKNETLWIEFWVDSSNNGSEKWSQRFTSEAEVQTAQVHHNVTKGSGQSWYLNVYFNLNHSHIRSKLRTYSYLSLNATLNWTDRSSTPMPELVLINTTRVPLASVCGSELDLDPPHVAESMQPVGLRRSLFKAEELNSEDIQITHQRTSSLSAGKKCTSTTSIFECGIGATCVMTAQGVGVCECLGDYIRAQNGSCIPNPVDPPVDPTVEPVPPNSSNSTYSSALGAILSIVTLLAIAAAVFFGTKYNVFSRIRSHLPLEVPVWPFRRSGTIDDQVDMVDPFSQEEDDPPLL